VSEEFEPTWIKSSDTQYLLLGINENNPNGGDATLRRPGYSGFIARLFCFDRKGKFRKCELGRGHIFPMRVTHVDHSQTHIIVLADTSEEAMRIATRIVVNPATVEVLQAKLAISI